jgi:glutathione S-transferase
MMITLYSFGPAFGLPDPSPFVTKAELLLKMAGQPFRTDTNGFNKAPKGKLPYIDDDGARIGDSTFIRWHLETKFGIDFDRGLTAEQRSVAWAFEKMAEDHLYWTVVDARCVNDVNFRKGPVAFFQRVPAPLRPLVIALMRRQVRKSLHAHGMGRHSPDEIVRLATRDVDSIADYLGSKPYFMGSEPTGVDATIFSFVAGALCQHFATPIRAAAERHDHLKRYVGRMTARYYPDLKEIAGAKPQPDTPRAATATRNAARFEKTTTPGHGRGLRELTRWPEGLPDRQDTLRFSADVLPRLVTSSYSTVCPSLSVESPARSTAEICTNTSFSPVEG